MNAMHAIKPSGLATWTSAWLALELEPDGALRDQLLAAYAEPQRHYHTLQHLDECLDWFARMQSEAERPAEVALALWFHDAVYDVHAHDNEARSADWAQAALAHAGADPAVARRVHALVMATRHEERPDGPDAELLIDIDLSILGAPVERFAQYEQQVLAEYAHVPAAVRTPRRRTILQRFLDRPTLYLTPPMHALLEMPARCNLARSMAALA
nr:N-methyl-D-aspartate receptor NMDAR2C subunit [Variovorax ginsengisoli]